MKNLKSFYGFGVSLLTIAFVKSHFLTHEFISHLSHTKSRIVSNVAISLKTFFSFTEQPGEFKNT